MLAAALAGVPLPAPAAAQLPDSGPFTAASVHRLVLAAGTERTTQFCGTGLTDDGNLVPIQAAGAAASCANGRVATEVAGTVLRASARVSDLGLEDAPHPDGTRIHHTAQAFLGFSDRLTFGVEAGVWRIFYRLEGERRTGDVSPPEEHAAPVHAGEAAVYLWGDDVPAATVTSTDGAPRAGHLDVPFRDSALAYSVDMHVFASNQNFARGGRVYLAGENLSDFSGTFEITRVAVLSADGVTDLTASAAVRSELFEVGPDGSIAARPAPAGTPRRGAGAARVPPALASR